MQKSVDISFEQLLEAVMKLPKAQFLKLKETINQKKLEKNETSNDDFLNFLSTGPVVSDEELKEFEGVDKWIRKWKPS